MLCPYIEAYNVNFEQNSEKILDTGIDKIMCALVAQSIKLFNLEIAGYILS